MGVSEANVTANETPEACIPIDEAENAPWMDSALGVLLDGSAVKEMRQPPKISFADKAPSSRWIAAVSAAVYFLAAKDAENTK